MAQVDQKGFSERIVSAPVSPLGQRLYVKTKDATSVALPTTTTVDAQREVLPQNQEQKVHPLYDYAFVTDRTEGLVVVGPLHTLMNGNPSDNFVKRVATFNPDGVLAGATSAAIAGTNGFVTTPRGLVVVDLQDPLKPRVIGQLGAPLHDPHAVAIQFRYAFVLDAEGLKVVDVTVPDKPRAVDGAKVPFAHAHGLYVARTYPYVAAGPRRPRHRGHQDPREAAPRPDLQRRGRDQRRARRRSSAPPTAASSRTWPTARTACA